MSIYNYGVTLNSVPTGFGIYTGMAVTNSGNFPIDYTITLSATTFDSTVTTAKALGGTLYDTIFLSQDPDSFDITDKTDEKVIKISDSGVFYILHRPFNTFATVGDRATGLEFATLTINSTSTAGNEDSDIFVSITGQRATGFQIPSHLGNFYAIKGEGELEFHWEAITPVDYFTGFRFQLATNTNFSSLVTNADYTVNELVGANSANYLPVFGHYSGFVGIEYEKIISNLSYGQDYYARVCPINVTGGTGAYIYCTGFNSHLIEYDNATYSGLHPSPGANLKIDATGLYLTYQSDYENDFDLYAFIRKRNGDSDNFLRYSGVNIKISPQTDTSKLALFRATTVEKGALNFVPPTPNVFSFSTGIGGYFRVEVEMENLFLLGKFGTQANSANENPGNGGPIIKFANYTYSGNPLSYYLYKDADTRMYAGAAGLQFGQTYETSDSIIVDIKGSHENIYLPPDLAGI